MTKAFIREQMAALRSMEAVDFHRPLRGTTVGFYFTKRTLTPGSHSLGVNPEESLLFVDYPLQARRLSVACRQRIAKRTRPDT